MIDLHTHSTHSDGFLSPAQLLTLAKRKKIEALALTDHDAVSGLDELHAAAKNNKIEIINGAELTVDYPKTDMEIIALDIPQKSLKAFKQYQKDEIKRRKNLATDRLEILQKAGFNLSYEDVAYDANGNLRPQIRRPHFVDALLRKGYIKDVEYAYQKIFSKDGICNIENKKTPVKDIISFIRENDAIAILAHPIHTLHEGKDLYNLVKKLQKLGLNGIEVLHSSQDKIRREHYLEIITDLKMITAGGSDFHGGTAHPENKLGTGNKHNLNIPYFVLDVIKNRKTPPTSYYKELKKYL